MNEFMPGGEEFVNDLGMTIQRMNELVRITNIIMSQEEPIDGYGRTSHVLLGIAGRKDLNDLEKIVCTLIFSTKILKDYEMVDIPPPLDSDGLQPSDRSLPPSDRMYMPITELPEIESLGFKKGILIAPSDIDIKKMMDMLMMSIKSLAKQLPKEDAIKFCRTESIRLARMSVTL